MTTALHELDTQHHRIEIFTASTFYDPKIQYNESYSDDVDQGSSSNAVNYLGGADVLYTSYEEPMYNQALERNDHNGGFIRESQTQMCWYGSISGQNNMQHPIDPARPDSRLEEYVLGLSCPLTSSNSPASRAPASLISSSEIENSIQKDEVCFGMITELKAEIQTSVFQNPLTDIPAKLTSASSFSSGGPCPLYGYLNDRESQIIQALLEEKELELQVHFSSDDSSHKTGKKRSADGLLRVGCRLNVIIYGPKDLSDDIGDYLEKCKCHLQDPIGCYKDVRYYNPHRLSSLSEDDCPMTISTLEKRQDVSLGEFQRRADVLDVLDREDDLPETNQSRFIKTSLLSHQKQALTFLMNNERDGAKCNLPQGVTETKIDLSSLCGGILADPMGLGKSLTVLALIASDLVEMDDGLEVWNPGPTLLIVPLTLLETWKGQIREHTQHGTFHYFTHYGSQRIEAIQDLQKYNVIITTYQTVLADWRKTTRHSDISNVFSVNWRRIVLDEAHVIRNAKSETSKALCELRSRSRWAVTGTPIQNGLEDLTSLLKIIDLSVYSAFSSLAKEVTNLWRRGGDDRDDSVACLKSLLRHVLLRRPARTISLPHRHDVIYPLNFSQEEMSLYELNRSAALSDVNAAMNSAMQCSSNTRSYLTVLQKINCLRMICNLGTAYERQVQGKIEKETSPAGWSSSLTEKYFTEMLALGKVKCSQCSVDIDDRLGDIPGQVGMNGTLLYMSECLRLLCVECFNINSFSMGWCGHSPPCHVAPVSRQSTTKSSVTHLPPSAQGLPTKVLALMQQLQAAAPGSKSVVFSTWTSSLDIIELGLHRASISYVRVDGTSTHKSREKELQKFREDPNIQVLLMTLACGSVGLNLTVASCAYLMEPSWNPTVEDQALARIHRMGQTKETRTVRFFIKGSLEEHIMRTQKSKEGLASLILQPSDRPGGKSKIEALQKIHSLL